MDSKDVKEIWEEWILIWFYFESRIGNFFFFFGSFF